MFRQDHIPKKEIINIVFNHNGMGDWIAYMTAINHIKTNNPWVQINLLVPDLFFDLACNLVPGIEVHKFSEGPKAAKFGHRIIRTADCSFTSLRSHLVNNGFAIICNKDVEIQDKNYCKLNPVDISKFNLPQKYVIVTCGFTSKTREMPPDIVNKLSDYIISKNYIPVYLGKKEAKLGLDGRNNLKGNFRAEIDFTKGINLIDKTNLVEAGSIINGAKCLIACDNGLAHLAGCTDIPIVVSYTNVKKEHRLPIRNNILGWNCYPIEPDETVQCRFCQSNWSFVKQEFTECYYVEQKLDNEIKCVKNLTIEKYINELEKIL
jgi:ADP-heptose:LPS heptosyltransferase